MASPRKLSVLFATFPYGGNGGVSSEVPDVRDWLLKSILVAKQDERIDRVAWKSYSDTPIPMTRNLAVREAQLQGFDVLVMVDSDMRPDFPAGPGAEPFWQSSFSYLYDHYERGPVTIFAPYCGPPPDENVYVFRWRNRQSDHPNADATLDQFSREEASMLCGIQPVAAGPTGLIMHDLRVFSFLSPPYHYYEWTDEFQTAKASTEDVTLTRDLALVGVRRLGYNPLLCNWSAWAGHWKPKCVAKPVPLTVESMSAKLAEALAGSVSEEVRLVSCPIAQELEFDSARDDGNQTSVDLEFIKEALLSCLSVEGDVCEFGCNQGRTSVYLADVLQQAGSTKKLHLFDSFRGLPAHSPQDVGAHPVLEPGNLKATVSDVFENFRERELPDPVIHPGWFSFTVSDAPDNVAFALLDGDLYASIKVSLEAMWKRLSIGGAIVVDDYSWDGAPGVKAAVDEFIERVSYVEFYQSRGKAILIRKAR